MSRRSGAALAASPVLVGAVTVLVTIVAVFLSYNANSGLPFVPTYDLNANLPNAAAARARLRGADRRRARGRDLRDRAAQARGRVDLRARDDEARQGDRAAAGRLQAARPPALGPRPQVHRAGAGPRGRRDARGGLDDRRRQACARPSSSTSSSTCSTASRARRPAQLARRLSAAASRAGARTSTRRSRRSCRCCATSSRWRANLSTPETRLGRFFKELGDAAEEAAPVAEEQASLFVNLDIIVHRARRASRGRSSRRRSREGPPTEEVAIRRLPAPAALHPQPDRALPRAAPRRRDAAARPRRSSPTPSRPAPRCCRRRSR